jgi:hypothetical protein
MLTRQLNRGGTDTSAAAMDEDGLAVLQSAAGEERVVSGDEDRGDATRIDQVNIVRNRHGLGRAHGDELRVRATFDQEEDAITDGRRADSRPDSRDHPGCLETEDVAGPGRRWIETLALEQVGAVDTSTSHADHDLTRSGDRVGALLDVELLRPTRR